MSGRDSFHQKPSMKPKSFSVTWIGPEFDGDFFWSVICAQVGMILNILGLIVEPWLSWLFWAVLVMSQRAKPKVFFFVKRPWWDLTQRRRFWRSCGGERQGELWCRSSLDEAQSWGLEMNPPNYRVAMGVSMVNFESRYSNMCPLKFSGSHPFFLYKYPLSIILYTERFVLSNSRAELLGNLVPLNPQAETQEGGYARDSLWRIGGVRQGLYGDQRGIDYELWKIMIRVTF